MKILENSIKVHRILVKEIHVYVKDEKVKVGLLFQIIFIGGRSDQETIILMFVIIFHANILDRKIFIPKTVLSSFR